MKNQLISLAHSSKQPTVKLLHSMVQSSVSTLCILITMIIAIGTIDFFTGFEFSVSFLYIFPVMLATWTRGWYFGTISAFFAATTWSVALYAAGFPAPSPAYPIWNTFMRFCILATVGYVFSYFKQALDFEIEQARTDSLSGIANRREFLNRLETELNRSNHSKRPFSVAYLDLDDFKKLNDTGGHGEGDRALRAIGMALRQTCRKMDIPGRIGGDEFALLLPETDKKIAQTIIDRFRERFSLEIQHQQWALGVSIGVINSNGGNLTAEQILSAADAVMYKAKHAGKNKDQFESL